MLNDIAIFIEIVRSGSLSVASEKLGIPANTISRRLAKLEQLLGTPLILRSTRALRCTPAGERLYDRSGKYLDALRLAVDSLRQLEGQTSGTARVQVSPSFFELTDKNPLNNFFKRFPNIQIELIVSEDEPSMIEDGIDLLLRIGKPKKTSFSVTKLCDITLGLYASQCYLDERGSPKSIGELKNHSFIKNLNRTAKDILILEKDGEIIHTPIHGVISCNSMLGLIKATNQDLGISLLNNCIAMKNKNLVRLLPEYYLSTEGFYAVHHNHRTLSDAASKFLEYIIEQAQHG